MVRVNPDEIRRAGLVKGQLPLAPGRESLRWSDREVRMPTIARTTMPEREFYSRRQPAPVERVPFEQQQRALQERIARGAPESARGAIPRGAEGGPRSETATGGMPRGTGREGAQGGLRPLPGDRGAAESDAGIRQRGESRSGSEGGWRTFGGPRSEPPTSAMPRGPGREGAQGREAEARTLPADRGAGGPETGVRQRGESRSGSEGGWRRFGEPRSEPPSTPRGAERETNRSVDPGVRGVPSDRGRRFTGEAESGAWRRLGESPSPSERREAPSDSGWRRFGEPGRSGQGGLIHPTEPNRPMERMPAEAEPRREQGPRGGESSGWRRFESQPSTREPAERRGGERQEFYQRERSEPRFESPRFERPRSEAPRSERYQAPRMERSDTARGGGGDRAPRFESPRGMDRAPSHGGGRVESGGPRGGGGGGEARGSTRGDSGGSRGGGRGR
jgi:hypothetical protein